MKPKAKDIPLTDSAARLRLGIVRTARRLRQEAASEATRADPDLDRGAGDDRAPRPAHPERAGGARAGQAADRDPHPGLPRPGGTDRAHARPRPTGAAPWSASTPPAASGCGACAGARTPTWRGACASMPGRRRRDAGAGGGDPRADAGGVAAAGAVSAALRRSFNSLEVPNYRRYFTGQLISLSGTWMQTVAAIWLILSLTGSGVAVGLTTALQFLPMLLFGAWGGLLADRIPKRRLLITTQALMAIPAVGLFAVTATGVVAPWMVFLAVFAMGSGQRGRQPDPAELRDRDGRPRPGRQRGQPQQRDRADGADRRARRVAGAADRRLRRRPLLRAQRAHLRGDDRRPLGDGPARPAHRAGRAARAGRDPRRPALRPRHPRAGGAAGADGAGRDARLQLPGGAAAAGQIQLRRRRRRPTR